MLDFTSKSLLVGRLQDREARLTSFNQPPDQTMFDAQGVSVRGRGDTNREAFILDRASGLFAVAQGLGGGVAHLASRMAIETLHLFVKRSVEDDDFTWPFGIDPNLSFDGNRLRTGVMLANRRLLRMAESDSRYSGVGTALVALLTAPNADAADELRLRGAVAHIGHTRLYILASGDLVRLTVDDTWAGSLGGRDATEHDGLPLGHPMNRVLTRALGAHSVADVTVQETD